MRRLLITVAGFTTAALAVLVPALPAQAHTELLGSDPGRGKTVAAVPDLVTLQFSQPLLEVGARIQVTGPDGRADDGAATVAGAAVAVPLKPGLPAGGYSVAWRVTSPDGHPIDGTFRFSASGPGQGAAAPASPSPTPEASPTTPAATTVTAEAVVPAGDAEPTSGTPTTAWTIAGVAIVVAGLGAALVALRRPRRRSDPANGPPGQH